MHSIIWELFIIIRMSAVILWYSCRVIQNVAAVYTITELLYVTEFDKTHHNFLKLLSPRFSLPFKEWFDTLFVDKNLMIVFDVH